MTACHMGRVISMTAALLVLSCSPLCGCISECIFFPVRCVEREMERPERLYACTVTSHCCVCWGAMCQSCCFHCCQKRRDTSYKCSNSLLVCILHNCRSHLVLTPALQYNTFILVAFFPSVFLFTQMNYQYLCSYTSFLIHPGLNYNVLY